MRRVIQLSIMPWGMINCFLIQGISKHILVDTGTPGSTKRIINQLKKLNVNPEDISLIVITHGHIDHFGSAAELKNMLNVPILIHQLDKESLTSGRSLVDTLKANNIFWDLILKPKLQKDYAFPCEPDIILHNNEVFDLSVYGIVGSILHTPGHTRGSLSVILGDGSAIIMDLASSGILLGGIAFNARMKHPPFHDNLQDVKRSLDFILSFPVNRFYLGHGNPVSRQSIIKYRNRL